MYSYPVELTEEDGGFIVTFPDLPFGITEGDDREDALARAVDALETVMISLIEDRKDIPAPSAPNGRDCVSLPALASAKVGLYTSMRAAGVRKADLARKMGLHMPQVDRLLDLRHASRLDQIEAALRALGLSLRIEIGTAA